MSTATFCTNLVRVPAAVDHVSHVVDMGSNLQVGRIHARRVVASMSNNETLRYFSDEHLKS